MGWRATIVDSAQDVIVAARVQTAGNMETPYHPADDVACTFLNMPTRGQWNHLSSSRDHREFPPMQLMLARLCADDR